MIVAPRSTSARQRCPRNLRLSQRRSEYRGGAGAAQVDQGADDEDPNEERKPGKPERWGGHGNPNHDASPAQPVRQASAAKDRNGASDPKYAAAYADGEEHV